jgi:Na+/H+ antiporter NhaD/arsenite permease-like protein
LFKFIGFCAKIIPSIVYAIKFIIYVRDSFISIPEWLKFIILYVIPFIIILGTLLYIFVFKDAYERQISKEQDENESQNYTMTIQLRRMFRKYLLITVIGILGTLLFYFYKPNIIALAINGAYLFGFFLAGETCRIVDIGLRENKRTNKELKRG